MFEESRAAFFRLREDDAGAGADWPLARLAESARLAGRLFGEPLLGTLEPGAPADLVVLDYAAPAPLDARELRRPLDLRPLGPRRARRDGRAASGSSATGASRASTRPSSPPPRASQAERLWRRLDEIPAHEFEPKGGRRWPSQLVTASRSTCRTSTRSATACATRSSPRRPASRPSGRRRAGSSARRPCRWPPTPPSPSGSRSAPASSTPGRATSACSPRPSRRSTTSRPAGSGSGSAPGGSRSPRRSASHRHHPLQAMRETVEATRRLLAMERVTYHGDFVHLDDVEIDIVHGDRSPKHVPIYVGATGMKMMELAGEIGDGVLLNYLVGPGYNRQAMEALATGAERAGRTRRRPRPAAARRLLARRRPLARARPRPRARRAVPRPAAAHHEGERRRRVAARGDRRVLTWPATPEQIERAMAPRPGRGRPADHRLRHAGRVPGEGATSTSTPAARARCSTRSATTSRR